MHIQACRRTVLIVVGVVVATLASGLLLATPAKAWYSLPGGRPSFVVSAIAGPTNAVSVRLATYQFRKSGYVTQEYWTWRQNSIKGKNQYTWTKPSSGYKTSGCRYTCAIRTPVGFQSGKSGIKRTGRFYVSGSVLVIKWSRTWTEKWRIDTTRANVAGLSLISSKRTTRGWGLGSTAGLNRAVDMKAVHAAARFYGPYVTNAYGRATRFSHVGFSSADNVLCGNGICMQGKYVTSSDKRRWYSDYWATNPAKDGRKVFHNHQTGAVQQMESRGSNCISRGGGHTDAMLQALDDRGRIIGLVGVEASLSQRKTGQAVVSAFAMVHPSVGSLVK